MLAFWEKYEGLHLKITSTDFSVSIQTAQDTKASCYS